MKYSLKQRVFIYDNFVKYEFKQNIQHEIGAISENKLQQVAGHVIRRCEARQITQGYHFEHEL